MIFLKERKNSNGLVVWLVFVNGVYNSTHNSHSEALAKGLTLKSQG